MENDRTIGLVNGFDEYAPLPRDVYRCGLEHRYAIILDTYRRKSVDVFFDTELYLAILPKIVALFGHDAIVAVMQDGTTKRALGDLVDHITKTPDDDREPAAEIRLLRGQLVSGIICTEFWTVVGGPSPYSDSYTISVYSKLDLSFEIQSICAEVAQSLGAVISRKLDGAHRLASDVPATISLKRKWRKLLRILFPLEW